MSAITAIYNLNRCPVDLDKINRSLDCLQHRGSDGIGVWVEKNIGLGHRMSWSTPESLHENLPYEDNKICVITADARVDNREELIKTLNLSKASHLISDSELILESYYRWGESCPAKIIGDFVFVIWDKRERKLFCARDPLGVKHFYYYYNPGESFILASEIKSLITISNRLKQLNKKQLGNFLTLNFNDKVNTFYKNIKRLPATSAMVISLNGFRIWKYWAPHPTREIKLSSPADYHEAFQEKFTEAVVSRLRSNYPIGSMLSGGLDSSSIVCAASRYLASEKRDAIHSFSAVFPTVSKLDKRIDELDYMKSAINHSGCSPHFVNCDDFSPLEDMDKMMWHTEQPIVGANAYIDWNTYKLANKNNVRVILSGIDGDSTVSYGYEDLANMVRRGYWGRLLRDTIALKKNLPRKDHTYKELLWRQGLATAVPVLDYLWQLLRTGKINNLSAAAEDSLETQILNKQFSRQYGFDQNNLNAQKTEFTTYSTSIEKHWCNLTTGLMAYNLELLEKLSQAFALNQWYPFCDRRLIEFCISLPPGQRIYKGWTRSVIRHAMKDILPPNIQWRKDKAVLSAGIRLNFLKFELKRLENTIGQDSWVIDSFVDVKFVRELLEQHKARPLKGGTASILLLNLVYLSNWLRNNGLA